MTYDRYETERKGFWLKTSLSINRWSRSQDIANYVTTTLSSISYKDGDGTMSPGLGFEREHRKGVYHGCGRQQLNTAWGARMNCVRITG